MIVSASMACSSPIGHLLRHSPDHAQGRRQLLRVSAVLAQVVIAALGREVARVPKQLVAVGASGPQCSHVRSPQ